MYEVRSARCNIHRIAAPDDGRRTVREREGTNEPAGKNLLRIVCTGDRLTPVIELGVISMNVRAEFSASLEQVISMTIQNIRQLDGTTESVVRMIAESDVVLGVWKDDAEPDGVGVVVIKGDQFLASIGQIGQTVPPRMTALPCDCAEMAFAAKEAFGEQPRV
jgi:hypothetical protein